MKYWILTTCLMLGLCLAMACQSAGDRAFDVDAQLDYCHQQTERTLAELRNVNTGNNIDYSMTPRNIGADERHWNRRSVKTPEEWCAGFFPGILWMDGDTAEAARFTEQLEYLANSPVYDHDLGFIMIGSYLKGWEQLMHDSTRTADAQHYRSVLLAAADTLATLFNPQVGTLLSWPRNVELLGGHNTIMDNMINLELLLWTSLHDGGQRLRDIAVSHADTTMRYHFRPDATSYHVAIYDSATGQHLHNCTHQGAADESMWARGQAWAIYGYTMVYRYTHEARFLHFAQRVTDAYLERLPDESLVPFWDFSQTDYRDASAAAIVASALIDLAYLSGKTEYRDKAVKMLQSLSAPPYRSGKSKPSFLLHSVGNMPAGSEIDASINYADYYYLEALKKLKNLNVPHETL